ncbi:MAG: transposase, partial [Methylophaga sp.]|nr:transposase [Methylophaga sp.]
ADEDYLFYLEKLADACEPYGCQVHAYVLMTNHVHLLMTPLEPGAIGKVMQSVGRRYVQYFNYGYRRTGTLWEGRYKASLIDSERYALTCYRYIELNPVRAGMVESPADYRWSSYHVNALGKQDDVVSAHFCYEALGDNDEIRRQRYRDLFAYAIDGASLDEIRQTVNKGWALGSEKFKREVEALLALKVSPQPRGGDRKSVQYLKRKV